MSNGENGATNNHDANDDGSTEKGSQVFKGGNIALLRALTFAKVKFIRYVAVDVCNTVRCKAVPIDHIVTSKDKSLSNQVATATIVFAGLPAFGDYLQPETGIDAKGILWQQPDLSTLRILPYAPKSAAVLTTQYDPLTGKVSDLCGRGLLEHVVRKAASEHNIGFNVGIEIELTFFDAKTNQPIDGTRYAESTLMNRHEDFISVLHDQLHQQEIPLSILHSESAPGQMEVVLSYQEDPVLMADNLILARETINAVAHKYGIKAIFLPKIDPMRAGSGCHVHLSVRDLATGKNLIGKDEPPPTRQRHTFLSGDAEDISPKGQFFMEGILQHLGALTALTLPTANSFRRIGPGCWTGSAVTWAFDDKEAPLRVVSHPEKLVWEHIEYKLCDNTANMYLALAAILSAGVEGLVKQEPLRPSMQEVEKPGPLPATVVEALDTLEKDSVMNQVFSPALMKAYLALRRAEAKHAEEMTLEDEVKNALDKAN